MLLCPEGRSGDVLGPFKIEKIQLVSGNDQVVGTSFTGDVYSFGKSITDDLHRSLCCNMNDVDGSIGQLGKISCPAHRFFHHRWAGNGTAYGCGDPLLQGLLLQYIIKKRK